MTADAIERGRKASISQSPEALRRKSSLSPTDVARRKSSLSPSAEARRKSSLRITMDEGGASELQGDTARLAARLGEANFLTTRTKRVQEQVDKLSVLMQQHVAFQQRRDAMQSRTVRFGN
jgi:hypothetical protein